MQDLTFCFTQVTFQRKESLQKGFSAGVQVPACARLAIEAVQSGMCAVIGLQSTGEANTKAAAELDDVLDDFVSAPQMVLIQFLTKHFPITRPKNSSHAQLDELLGKASLPYFVKA